MTIKGPSQVSTRQLALLDCIGRNLRFVYISKLDTPSICSSLEKDTLLTNPFIKLPVQKKKPLNKKSITGYVTRC